MTVSLANTAAFYTHVHEHLFTRLFMSKRVIKRLGWGTRALKVEHNLLSYCFRHREGRGLWKSMDKANSRTGRKPSSFSLYCLIGCSSSISDRNNNYKAWSLTSSYTHIGIQAHTSDLESPVQGCFSPSSSLSNTHRPRHKYTDATGCYHSDVTVVGSYGSWPKTGCDCGHLWDGSSKTLKA